jgi:hypothetical protein
MEANLPEVRRNFSPPHLRSVPQVQATISIVPFEIESMNKAASPWRANGFFVGINPIAFP